MIATKLDPSGYNPSIRIVVVQPRRFDCDVFIRAVKTVPWLNVIFSSTVFHEGLSLCEREQVDIAVLDASFPGNWVNDRLNTLISTRRLCGAMLLDEKPNLSRQSSCSDHCGFAYFTRQASFLQLCDGIRQIAAGRLASDPNLSGWKFESAHGQHKGSHTDSRLNRLTPREKEVWRLVALGNTVKECASILHLAQSTVDNHKSRLMRKLEVHKSSELTRLAIREGLMSA